MESKSEFRVRDVKNSLRVIARANCMQNIQKLTSPHRLLPRQSSQLQLKRLNEFIRLDRETINCLADALRPQVPGNSDTSPEMAAFEMRQLLKAYCNRQTDSRQNFVEFLRRHGVGSEVYYFARRWVEISLPKPSAARGLFGTESWAWELDRICPLIIKEQRRSARDWSTEEACSAELDLIYRRDVDAIVSPPGRTEQSCASHASHSATPSSPTAARTLAALMSPDSPEDERALKHALLEAGVPLRLKFSPPAKGKKGRQRFARAARQHVPGQLIAASASQLPELDPRAPSPQATSATASHAGDSPKYTPPYPGGRDTFGLDELITEPLASSGDPLEMSFRNRQQVKKTLSKYPVAPGTVYSSIALPTQEAGWLRSSEEASSTTSEGRHPEEWTHSRFPATTGVAYSSIALSMANESVARRTWGEASSTAAQRAERDADSDRMSSTRDPSTAADPQ